MDVKTAIKSRRAVKHFDPEHRMTQAEKDEIISLALLSPTAFNIQNWRFVLVEDKEMRQQLRKAAFGQAQVTDASMLFVLCADTKAWKKNPGRYWAEAPEEVQKMVLPMIEQFYSGREWIQRDEAIRSTGIAAQTLMLLARDMGYDSCPMDGFDYDAVCKIINLPDDHVVSLMVAIGKATQDARPRGGQLSKEDVVIKDKFN